MGEVYGPIDWRTLTYTLPLRRPYWTTTGTGQSLLVKISGHGSMAAPHFRLCPLDAAPVDHN